MLNHNKYSEQLFFSCEKEILNTDTSNHFEEAFVTEFYSNLSSDNILSSHDPINPANGSCGETAVVEQTDDSALIPLFTEQGFQLLWNDFQNEWPQAPQTGAGGGGVMHDITIWPTKALQDHGFGGTIGISFTLGQEYFAANPALLISSEDITNLSLQTTTNAEWAAIASSEDGQYLPNDTETGWLLQAVFAAADGGIGVIISIDDVHAYTPVIGNGIVIVPNDDLGIDSEIFSSVNYGGIVLVEEDAFAQVPAYSDQFIQSAILSFNENTPYGLFPQVEFDFLTESGTPKTLSVLLNNCLDDNLLYWGL